MHSRASVMSVLENGYAGPSMRVKLFPADDMGCGHYRMYYPGRVLDITSELDVSFSKHVPMRLSRDHRVIGVEPIEADVVVLQRPLLRLLSEVIPHLQRRGITVVVDIDDDFSSLHPNHPVRVNTHPKNNPESNWHHLKRACALADLVTVTTPALAERYGARGNAIVLPNCIPASMLALERATDERTVGWSGFAAMHVGDLESTLGGVGDAVRESGAQFWVVGSGDGVRAQLGLDSEPIATGGLTFKQYAPALRSLTVGIVPLADTKFNEAKSCLKGMEYAALGIPFVASPRADYVRLAQMGVGVLATDRRKSWRREVMGLLNDQILRRELSELGREVVSRYTYEEQAWRWAEAWEHAAR